jgi:plastocyanin
VRPWRARRIAQITAAVALTAVAAMALWPRPAVDIRIAPGGLAVVHARFGRATALPETIVVAAGGRPRVRITNADSIEHRLGLFSAPLGQVVEYTLPQPGTYTGLCSAHPTSETLTFVVR